MARNRTLIILILPTFVLVVALASYSPSLVSGQYGQVRGSVEVLLSQENAYNPIPSPDGKMIAFVRTGWGRPDGTGGFGRSNLITDVQVMDATGAAVTKVSLADSFLSGWTADGKKLVCYRDWHYSLISLDGKRLLQGEVPKNNEPYKRIERVVYLPSIDAIGWSRPNSVHRTSIETSEQTLAEHDGWLGEFVIPSPSGRYLAVAGESLQVYDSALRTWSDLGALTVHPDRDWDYIKPTWSPWFSDSSRLAFISGSNLVLSTPDGSDKTSIPINDHAGLATPSPDGKSAAFVTFNPRPRELQPDSQFWGGTIVWIVSVMPGSKPYAVTRENSAETYDLKWLNDGALLFDRVDDVLFYKKARIWKVLVSR